MFEGFEKRTVKANGVKISCAIAGQGEPLLLLHGFPQSMAMWARVAPELAKSFTVICADLRGYGDSSKPRCEKDNSNYSFMTFAQDQMELMFKLGFARFHLVGHDRGARTGHRMALSYPEVLKTLIVMDIAPTHSMFAKTNKDIAHAYWHWYFLSQPQTFPEDIISGNPDAFYENCLAGWGATKLSDFDQEMLAEYRRCWRQPEMIHGSCSDYRAGITVDLEHHMLDLEKKVECPVHLIYGSTGTIAKVFDLAAEWKQCCANLTVSSLPGGHFFVDQFPAETVGTIRGFVSSHSTQHVPIFV